ncbi:MAG TPA: hypothetical protein VIK18_12755 [Pirellulales bacterium]
MTLDPIVPQTPLQRLILEQALIYAQQLETAAAQAPHGRILDRCEAATLNHGRAFLRQTLGVALQQQADDAEKKAPPAAPAPAAPVSTPKAVRHARS